LSGRSLTSNKNDLAFERDRAEGLRKGTEVIVTHQTHPRTATNAGAISHERARDEHRVGRQGWLQSPARSIDADLLAR
jgi:hypothetical protein